MTPDIRKERETALYEAALRLIAKGGNPAAMKVQQIADEAGIGKGTVYEYFASKDEILQGMALYCFDTEIARIAKTKWDLGLAGGILIGNPVPEEYAMDFDEMTAVIEKAIAGANAEGVRGKNITPYLLAHIVEYTGGQSLKTNIQLAYNNARAAGKIAVAYARL